MYIRCRNYNSINKSLCIVVLLAIVSLFTTSCTGFLQRSSLPRTENGNIDELFDGQPDWLPSEKPDDPDTGIVEATPEVPQGPTGATSIQIRAVGDIMMHMPQVNAGLQADGTYSYEHFFADIKPYLEGADIVMGNFETTISNKEKGYGGYPMFRTPQALLDALSGAGFNVITTANNHSFDGKEFGVANTLDKLDEYGFHHTGTARSQDERDKVLVVEKNDIKVGILAYTYGTNGMEATISKEKLPYMVNYIDKERITEDVQRVKEAGAEIIITAIHWGDEYVRKPNSFQKDTADFLISQGVDVILGSHPHVLQPMERRKVTLEDGTEKDVFLIYSLGNFISNQREQYRDSGVIIELNIIKDYDNDTISLGDITYTPTWVHRYSNKGRSDYRVLPVGEFKEEGLTGEAQRRVEAVWKETTTHLGSEGFNIKN